jgi:tetratricopeptide (TPR) repeat protein
MWHNETAMRVGSQRRRRLAIVVASVLLARASVVVLAAQAPSARAKEAYARALELEANRDHSGALALLWEAAELAPHDADVQNRLGEALERMGALEAAVDAYRRALAERPAFRKAADNLILALVKSGRGGEALERARALVAAAPDDPNGHFTLGLAQSEQDIAEAIGSFRRALELAPRHSLARYNLALVLKRADRADEAVEELTRAIEIEPRAEAHYTLGVIYWQRGDLNRAASALRAAVAADPQYADAHYTLGAVLGARRDWTGAAESLRRALALRPDLAGAHYTLARVLLSAGDDRAARMHLAEADRLRQRAQLEQEAGVWTTTGIEKLEAGDLVGAIDHFRRATSIFEAYAPAHYQMALAFERLGQHDASRAAFARARQLNPTLVPPRDQ